MSEAVVTELVDDLGAFYSDALKLNNDSEFDLYIMMADTPEVSPAHIDFIAGLDHRATTCKAAHQADEAEMSCCVCLEEFSNGDRVIGIPCDRRHAGHVSCMKKWLASNAVCPMCRRGFPTQADGISGEGIDAVLAQAGEPLHSMKRRRE